MSMQHFLSVADADPDTMQRVLRLAMILARDRARRDILQDKTIALLFEKPSLRTRASFEVGVSELGGRTLPMWDSEIGLGKRETVQDTARVLERYVHGIVLRTFAHSNLTQMAAAVGIPVVNALSDHEHPCQAVADLLTMQQSFGEDLTGRRLTYVGDGNNVAHSLLLAGALVGMDVIVAHPVGYAPDEAVVAQACAIAQDTGAEIGTTTDPIAGCTGADAIYTDVWSSMGQEAESETRKEVFASYQVSGTLVDRAKDTAIVLHCLPAHRGEEIAADVMDGPRARVFDQAENRLHAQKAILVELFKDPSLHRHDPGAGRGGASRP